VHCLYEKEVSIDEMSLVFWKWKWRMFILSF